MIGSLLRSLRNLFGGRSPAAKLTVSDPGSVSAAVSMISKLRQNQDSVIVSVRGPVSSMASLLGTLGSRADSVSAILSVRGDKPVSR
jgi:ATP-dependent protease ClpP protease subunit